MSGDYALSATLKARSSSKYDAPWVVVYANDPGELKQRIEGVVAQGVLDALVAADNQLKVLSDSDFQNVQQQAPPQQQGAAWGTATNQGFQPGYANPQNQQQGPPPQQQGQWQQQGPPPQQGPRLHPEGKACACGKVLQHALTKNGKAQWKCEDYRWNNGNPNQHTQEWAN